MRQKIAFYEQQIAHYTQLSDRLRRQIYRVGTARLLLVIAGAIVLWIFRHAGLPLMLGAGGLILLLFLLLMVFHARLFTRRQYADRMMALLCGERSALDYDYSAFEDGAEQIDAHHSFALDLDLFGPSSLFHSMNRTVTRIGQEQLVAWLKRPLTDCDAIRLRQAAVTEVAEKSNMRHHFYVTGEPQRGQRGDLHQLTVQEDKESLITQSLFWRVMIWVLPSCWGVVIAGSVLGMLPSWMIGLMVCVGFFFASLKGREIHRLAKSMDQMEKQLQSYASLMKQVEEATFDAPLLLEIRHKLQHEHGSASQAIARLSRIIGALDQRYSLAGLILNLLYLRDIRQVMLYEQWIARHRTHFKEWADALAQMDALCSFGAFTFNHPDYTFPLLTDTYFCMEGHALGHPLMHRDRCVRNDFSLVGRSSFLVITGANMAGKSTYLRTVGVNFLLGCAGLPVCAESLTLSPAHLVTSLRTADSLIANESYFFAELKRLKMIIDRLDRGEQLFIILDEILKGTNSKDKQAGSMALMRQLITKGTCGVIATHDLLLGQLAKEFPQEVQNFCFEADIKEETLSFTYLLRPGVAQNMNASFLMRKMGITLSDSE